MYYVNIKISRNKLLKVSYSIELFDQMRDVIRGLKRVQRGRAGNWYSGLGLAYPHLHEDISVSVPYRLWPRKPLN